MSTTLGTGQDEQIIDNIEGEYKENFLLNYIFPLYSVGEVGPMRAPSSWNGDPADVLVIAQYPILPGAIIKVRPVGVLMMEDESGMDEKILAVPTSKLDITFDSIQDIGDEF